MYIHEYWHRSLSLETSEVCTIYINVSILLFTTIPYQASVKPSNTLPINVSLISYYNHSLLLLVDFVCIISRFIYLYAYTRYDR